MATGLPAPELDARPQEPQPQHEKGLSSPSFHSDASATFRKSFSEFQSWVHSQHGRVHAAVVDLETDRWLLQIDEGVAVNVASNAKIITAAAALELLGPAWTFPTEVLGKLSGTGEVSPLILRGGGAPDLTDADLWRLVQVLRGLGVSRVGDIVVDLSRFAEQYVPPAYEQQPEEWAPFRANISALAVNENALALNVMPTSEGQAARVWYSPQGVIEPRGQVMTAKKGTGDRVTWTLDPSLDKSFPLSVVGGRLAVELGRRRYARRLEDPRRAGGLVFRSLLLDAGVEVTGEVRLGPAQNQPRLALWNSAPLAELVRALGKDSNNFYAEMLLVALSAAHEPSAQGPWSSHRGAEVIKAYLTELGADVNSLVVKNGSGLFDANRYSAESLVQVLARVEDNPRVFQDFVSHLAILGTDGTLQKRMRGAELASRIRAKTGTLRSCNALSGYILRTRGKSPAAFSIVVEGIAGQHAAIRRRVDRLVLAWAAQLEQA